MVGDQRSTLRLEKLSGGAVICGVRGGGGRGRESQRLCGKKSPLSHRVLELSVYAVSLADRYRFQRPGTISICELRATERDSQSFSEMGEPFVRHYRYQFHGLRAIYIQEEEASRPGEYSVGRKPWCRGFNLYTALARWAKRETRLTDFSSDFRFLNLVRRRNGTQIFLDWFRYGIFIDAATYTVIRLEPVQELQGSPA